MTTTTARKTTTPTTGPGANGRYNTKMERVLAILRQDPDITVSVFRHKFLICYGDELGDSTVFYRARNQVKAGELKAETVAIKAREQSAPNVAERPIVKRSADVPADAPQATRPKSKVESSKSAIVPLDAYDRIDYEAEPAYRPDRLSGQYTLHESITMAARQPILTLAASLGGLLPLRRAVDECIAWLCPELKGEAKSP